MVEFDGVGTPKTKSITKGYCSQFAIFVRISSGSANKENITKVAVNEVESIAKRVKSTSPRIMLYFIILIQIIDNLISVNFLLLIILLSNQMNLQTFKME